MSGGVAAEIGDALAREAPAIRAFLDECGAGLVPEGKARALGLLGPDETYAPNLDELRRELLVTLKEIGKRQVGRAVETRWCFHAARELAEATMGVCDFNLAHEDNAEALRAVLDAARKQLAVELKKERSSPEDDIPF
jgi:hypothetical protein